MESIKIKTISCLAAVCVSCLCMASQTYASEPPERYETYQGLVMAGYQGWFNTSKDGANLGWRHYGGKTGFCPGSCTVDMWPETSEYPVLYSTEFRHENGDVAKTFSSHDPSTVDTHFRWMEEYGIDGVFMQRFICDMKRKNIRAHFDHVLDCAMTSADKHHRAIAIMYDLSGMRSEDVDFLLEDIDGIDKKHNLHNRDKNNSYLYHNGKPLVAVWGVGFNDGRAYGLPDAAKIIKGLKNKGFSIMLGVPTYWRELREDTDNDSKVHDLILQCDIVMPWFVGRYNESGFKDFSRNITQDLDWCNRNRVDYAPLCFPGFSWANMKGEGSLYIPRNHGSFFKAQLDNALECGAKMIYIAMFDEIDEGTAIFKCASKVPKAGKGTTFEPIDEDSETDLYLRLAGDASKKLKILQLNK